MSEEVLQKLFEAALRELPPQEQAPTVPTLRPEPVRREEPVADEATLKKLFDAALRDIPENEPSFSVKKPVSMTVGA